MSPGVWLHGMGLGDGRQPELLSTAAVLWRSTDETDVMRFHRRLVLCRHCGNKTRAESQVDFETWSFNLCELLTRIIAPERERWATVL